MAALRSFPLLLLLLSLTSVVRAQAYLNPPRMVALLDVTARNLETTDEELWSATHALKVAGVPFIITTSVTEAVTYGMVVVSSRIEGSTFTVDEDLALSTYVAQGGILVAGNVRDVELFPTFGIGGEALSSSHHRILFDMTVGDPALIWLNDTMEQVISLGDTALPVVVNSRHYTLAGGTALARFDNDSVAVVRASIGTGTAYALGFSFKNLVIKNLMNEDLEADRTYSNGFEPTTDVVFLLLRGIYQKHLTNAVWLHTSPFDSRSALLVTHDVDATTSYDTMHLYADFEHATGFSATYLITTHYLDDNWLSDFYNLQSVPKVQYLIDQGHVIGSHSVGHFTDFADPLVFPLGSLGQSESTYLPYNFGDSSATTNGTVLGEVEVSKHVLEQDLGIDCRTFRAGFLAFNPKLINGLDTVGYAFNSTFSANDVLTNFPYINRKNRSSSGPLTRVLEVPMTISDVNHAYPIDAANYPNHVANWVNVVDRNAANHAPTTLLIHPNRQFKLTAEQDLIAQLPTGTYVGPLEAYGDYWLGRDSVRFSTHYTGPDSLVVVIPAALLPLPNTISFIVEDGQALAQITAQDDNGNPVSIIQSNWNTNDLILHFGFNPVLGILPQVRTSAFASYAMPNPATDASTLRFCLEKAQVLDVQLTDMWGRAALLLPRVCGNAGWNSLLLPINQLAPGSYVYRIRAKDGQSAGRVVVMR